jgi:hypothetical protein
MAKKTRKEKLAADFRRSRLTDIKSTLPTVNNYLTPEAAITKKDLTKSLLLALLVLGFELVLYWQLKFA